ncbi:hypothetical protein [Paraburkholderia sp. J7]|uniref:hypothetical protein n=1 Tax=Paraburkholderia sp. J7 TaxID=2805438 RepID=UPI002AB6942E|nr:hypothetical protein [Paraburkholderia sp. J7]
MGYRLVVSRGRLHAVSALASSVQELVNDVERLRVAAAGALDRSLVTSLVNDLARRHGLEPVGDISKRKNFTPPLSGYMTEVQNKTTWASVFELFPRGGGKVTLSLEPDEYGVAAENCPNCGKRVIGQKPAVAHNIIPQQTWKRIVSAAISECLQNIESGNLTKKHVRSFSSLSGHASGVRFSAPDSGEPLGGKFAPEKAENKPIVDKLLAAGLINSAYAAQDNAGKQCLDCERKQSNATLIQRFALIKEKKLQSQIESGAIDPATFVGAQFQGLADRFKAADRKASVTTTGAVEELLGRVTIAQIGRFLLGIEKCIEEEYTRNPNSPLNNLLLDHWEEFVWSFRSVAMTQCNANYSGSLGIKGLVL